MFRSFIFVNLILISVMKATSANADCPDGCYQNPSDVRALSEQIAPAARTASGCDSVLRSLKGVASWYYIKAIRGKKGWLHMPPSGHKMDATTIAFAAKDGTADLFQIICVRRIGSSGHAEGTPVCGPVLDRGPFVPDRIIDAWPAAAQALHLKEIGKGKVEVEVCRAHSKGN